MQYKSETEKVAMTGTAYIPVPQPLSLAEDRQVQRTRKILMIILGVLLALSLIGLILTIFQSTSDVNTANAQRGTQLGQSLISILFYTFGLIVAHRYSEIGLRVFGWLGVILLVLMGIGIAILLLLAILAITAVATVAAGDSNNTGLIIGASVGAFIVVCIYAAAFILTLIIVKFAFKLARLIDANKHLNVQQNV